jgi:diguanylate cyclase (GGDEF)-like protein
MSAELTNVALALLMAVGGLSVYLHRRVRSGQRLGTALESETARLQRELALVRRQLSLLQSEQQFVSHFIREFPHLTGELQSGVTERRIPGVLLNIVLRILEPRQATVLLRRRKSESDPVRSTRLVVAAVSPANDILQTGVEVALGEGPVGLVAESQRAMDQRDFESHRLHTGQDPMASGTPGLEVDMAAPMVVGGETVGVLAVAGARRTSSEAKDVLRLIAQVGGLAVHHVSAYTQVRVTADLDGLTGIYNKRLMTEVLSETVFRAQQQSSRMAVFLFDVDNFKHYNDTNGHAAGDQLLSQLARLVDENVRKENTFGRFGGEEFLLVLPDTTAEQALIVAEKVRYLIAHHEFAYAQKQPLGRVTVSGGIAACPDHGVDSAALLRAADDALYEAKRQGRNRVLSGRIRSLGSDSDVILELAPARNGGAVSSWEWSSE